MLCLNIKIVGYYGHSNIGDEQYKKSFTQLFTEYMPNDVLYTLEFIDCDLINIYKFQEDDIIILGGGDVLNNYFLDKIIDKFANTNNKIYAISVGLPYIQTLISSNKLNIIDHVFIRTSVDIELFKRFFDEDKISYIPDVSYILSNNIDDKSVVDNYYLSRINTFKKSNKIVCVSLSRHIYHSEYIEEYNNIISNFAKFLEYLANLNYHIVFLPFNTSKYNKDENDILIHKDLLDYMLRNTNITLSNITCIDTMLGVDEIFNILSLVDLYLPMRFHACLFAIYNKIPFIPIYTTRKIDNLLKEIQWDHFYKLKTNEKDLPIELNYDFLVTLYENLINDTQFKQKIYNRLLHINMNNLCKCFSDSAKKLIGILTNNTKKSKTKDILNKTDKHIQYVFDSIQDFANSKGYNDFRFVDDSMLQDIIVSIVSYNLTNGSIDSSYNYGLKEKMFNGVYNYKEEWTWILNDFYTNKSKKLINNHNGLFNLGYVDQIDYSECHRFGWQYVYDNIKHLHNENSDLLLDMYVDRTFHWNNDVNKLLNIIPYTKPWIGFIHHTFDTTFSDYNTKTLLCSTSFIESLKCCKGLIVLSKYLKEQLERELITLGIKNVNVYFLKHPTDDNVPKFSLNKFLKNKDKRLIHIGGWLRNVYSFYNLTLCKEIKSNYGFLCGDKTLIPFCTKNISLRKVALKGKHMNNYFPCDNFINDIKSILTKKHHHGHHDEKPNCSHHHNCNCHEKPNCSHHPHCDCHEKPNCSHHHHCDCDCHCHEKPNCSHHPHCDCSDHSDCDSHSDDSSEHNHNDCGKKIINNWYKHFYNDISCKISSVEVIEHVDNDTYDNMLTDNIVFINLVDASAINTVIECVVRNIPIVVNKHPAVVEILGEKYPLYFENGVDMNHDVSKLLKDISKIRLAYYYLVRLNKKQLNIKYFISKLERPKN